MDELDFWDPMQRVHQRMNRLMENFLPTTQAARDIREPLLDVVDKDKSIEVLAELPGVEKDQISIEVENDALTLSAELMNENKKEDEGKGYFFHERAYQSFYRRIPLPSEVIASKAVASFKNGVLKVDIPKKEPINPPKGFKVQIR